MTNTPFKGEIHSGPMTLTYELVVSKNPIDEQVAALNREATTLKKVDWDKAVELLTEAAQIMRKHRSRQYSLYYWTRLPIFLQQAGQFKAAIKEFNRLLKEVEPRVKREAQKGVSQNWIDYQINLNLHTIYDKMRMACKREKLKDDENQYAKLAIHHADLASELRIVVNMEWDAERAKFEIEQEQKRLSRKSR